MSKDDDVEVDSNALTPTNNADDENARPRTVFLDIEDKLLDSMSNDKRRTSKVLTRILLHQLISVLAVYSLTSGDTVANDVPDVTGDAHVPSNKADGAASAGSENSPRLLRGSSVNVERQRNDFCKN